MSGTRYDENEITISQLHKYLSEQIANGYGDMGVYITECGDESDCAYYISKLHVSDDLDIKIREFGQDYE